jgi:hypothetical protein
LGCACLTILSYVSSATAAQRPWSFRYLVGLMVTIPALIAPLMNNQGWLDRIKLVKSKYINIFLLSIILIMPVLGTIQDIPSITSGDVLVQQQAQFINAMLARGINTIYSGYWVCDRLIFQSQEKLICAAIKPTMKPDLTRYKAYKKIVDQSKKIAYVFTEEGYFNPQDLINKFAKDPRYTQVRMYGYIVFIPLNGR